jgi:hypothetical protein
LKCILTVKSKSILLRGEWAFLFFALSDLPAEVPFTARRRERSSSDLVYEALA